MKSKGQGQPPASHRAFAHLVFLILYLVPMSFRRMLARRLAHRLLGRRPKRRRIVDTNLRYCFPKLDPRQRGELAVAFAERWLFSVMDMATLWFAPVRNVENRVRIEGRRYLDAAMAAPFPVILLAPHTVGLEQGAYALARHYPVLGLTREMGGDLGSWVQHRLRSRYVDNVYDRNAPIRKVITGLRSGQVLYYLPDEDQGTRRRSVFVPYFGRKVSTVLGCGRLVALCNATLLPCVTRLDMTTGHYTVKLGPPVRGLQGQSPEDICAVVRRELERIVRLVPEDYLWSLRIFDTLESGGRNPDYRAGFCETDESVRLEAGSRQLPLP